MVEFGPKPSESSNPHEGEGLSLAHWELLAKTPFKDPKINRFAQAVIEGQIEGAPEIYRQYLGNRHWNHIEDSLDRKVKGVRGTILSFRNRELLKSTQQLAKYAHYEQEFSYTLDDYYASLGGLGTDILPRIFRREENSNAYRWDGAEWRISDPYVFGADTNGQGGTPSFSSEPMKDLDIVLKEFLLTSDDVLDEANFKSPQQLTELAKSIDIQILNDRLTQKMRVRKLMGDLIAFKEGTMITFIQNPDDYTYMGHKGVVRNERPIFQQVGNWEKEI